MRPEIERAAVIGAGPIGCATAGHLGRRGLSVVLCDLDAEAIEPIRSSGGVRLSGVIEGEGPVALATTDPVEAVRGAQLVVCAVPASAHESVARAVAAGLEDGVVLMIQPGQTLSAVAFMHAARQAGLRADVTPVETLNTLFTARLKRPGEVEVYAVKRFVPYSAYPSGRTARAGEVLEPLFDRLVRASCILEVDLHNFNAVLHPPITLLNTGLIDGGRPFLYYMEGATGHVMKLVEALDRERMAVVEGLGLPGLSILEWFERVYGVRRESVYEAVRDTGPYRTIAAPASMNTRLLLEDVPTGLVPYNSIGRAAGVDTPVVRAVVDACCALYGVDFWATGRTLERFGLGGLDSGGLLPV